jgi:TonB family protein
MLSPGRWTPAATPSGINLNAMGKTYMAFTDIHNTYENAFKSGGCGGGIPFSGEINWNSCMFQVHLITYLDKPMPDGTVTITSAQAFSLGFAMDDTPNLPFNSMIPLAFTGRNAAGQTTFKDRSNYSLIMEGMGARSDLSRPENDAKRQIAARVRDVLVAHERDWHTSSEPIQSYPGANQQAEAVRKMIQQTMSPDTCNGCGVVHVGQAPAQVEVPPPPVPTISATTARLREAKQVAETARATVEQDTEQLAHSQSRMEAVLAEGTVPPAVQLRLRAHLEEVMIGPQRTTLTLAQANAAAAEQGYEKAKAEAQAAVAPGAPATTLTALYHVGGDVTPPQLIYAPDPEFSGEARRAMLPKGWLGVVVVSLIVDEQGYPQRVVVVRHQGMGLDEKAVEAVKQYRFKPAMLQGVPVSVEVNIEVNFKIY